MTSFERTDNVLTLLVDLNQCVEPHCDTSVYFESNVFFRIKMPTLSKCSSVCI